MDELRQPEPDVVAALDEDQALLLLAFARCLRNGVAALNVDGLDELSLEEPA